MAWGFSVEGMGVQLNSAEGKGFREIIYLDSVIPWNCFNLPGEVSLEVEANCWG